MQNRQEEIELWIEKTNPSLLPVISFSQSVSETKALPLAKLPSARFEVLWVKGAIELSDEWIELLNQGVSIILVESDLCKIAQFISGKNFPCHPNLTVIRGLDFEIERVAWKHLFQKMEFLGDLAQVKSHTDLIFASASEYRDYGKTVIENIHRNIIHTNRYIDGRKIHHLLSGQKSIVCGSGPSLRQNIDFLRAHQNEYVVIAAGSSVVYLLEENIQPDFFVFIDADPPLDLYERVDLSHIPLVYQNRMSSDLFFHHQGKKIWMGHGGNWALEEFLLTKSERDPWVFDGGWNAGTFAISFAHHIGLSSVITIGIDGFVTSDVAKTGNEKIVDGKLTRTDLLAGLAWIKEFEKKHPNFSLCTPNKILQKNLKNPLSKQFINSAIDESVCSHQQVQKVIGEIWTSTIESAIDEFFKKISEDSRSFIAYSALLDVELEEMSLIRHFLKPLWEIWSHVVMRKIDANIPIEISEVLARYTFYKSVLKSYPGESFYFDGLSKGLFLWGQREGEVLRHYPSGELFQKQYYYKGKEEGTFYTYQSDQKVKTKTNYKKGDLHGEYALYEGDKIKRLGICQHGQLDGIQTSYSREGKVVDQAEYQLGKKCGSHIKNRDSGEMEEIVTFHDEKIFDKKVFDEQGRISYEGCWEGGIFTEKRYLLGKCISERKAEMKEGEFCWINV